MKSTELKIKPCVCVLAQQHVWDGAWCAVLPSARPGSRGASVFTFPTSVLAFPTLSGGWQRCADDSSNREEGSVTGGGGRWPLPALGALPTSASIAGTENQRLYGEQLVAQI